MPDDVMSDSSQSSPTRNEAPPDNPTLQRAYAEFDALAARPDVLRGTGNIAPEDVVAGMNLARRGLARAGLVWIVLATLLMIVLASIDDHSGLLLWPVALLGAIWCVALCYWFWWRWWTGRLGADIQAAVGLEELVLSDAGTSSRSRLGLVRRDWDGFERWRVSRRVVVLYLRGSGEAAIVPRRYFADDAAWQALLEWLTRKLGPSR